MLRRATFYKHLRSKYEFFAFYIRELTDSSGPAAAGFVWTALREYFLQMSQELVRFPPP